MRRLLITTAFVFALAGTLFAENGGNDALVDAVKTAAASADPVVTFFGLFAKLPDTNMNGDELRDALIRSGAPPTDPMFQSIVGNIASFEKHGERITLHNKSKKATEIVVEGDSKGWVTIDPTFTMRIRDDGHGGVTIDDFDGIALSRKKDSTHASLKKIVFEHDHGKPIAKVTAGVFIFSKTVTVDLSDPAAAHAPPPPGAPSTPTPGITSRVPH